MFVLTPLERGSAADQGQPLPMPYLWSLVRADMQKIATCAGLGGDREKLSYKLRWLPLVLALGLFRKRYETW